MTRRLVCILAFCLAAVVSASSQEGPVSKPWWNSKIFQELNLSPQQRQQIRRIIRSYHNRLLDARTEADKAQADLEDLLDQPHINMVQAQAIIDRLADARANATRVFTEMSVQLRAVLTLQQWNELSARWEQEHRNRPNPTPQGR